MVRCRHFLTGCALVIGGPTLAAQSPYPQSVYPGAYVPLSDADRLAQQLRIVAANPTDLYALLAAARLSLQVGDTDAAAALYTRADRINPQHPQVKAGMARLLVQAGRPGEALRRFADAQALGATLADFGPDRALAYDLVGEQQRAQREYRALLKLGPDDETVRRYALSLGISGLKEPALAMLEPLNRRGDRGAWRARAFVLAMTGDRTGAEKIATTMMPAGMAAGLDPFFNRLPRLDPRERAFAVNFGETRASPARLADARLVPQLPALSSEPDPFPVVRQQAQFVARDDDDGRKKNRKKKDRPPPVRVASQPYVAPLPPPPAPTAAQLASLSAVRMAPGSFMPAATSRGVTVLPPPPEAYRGPAVQMAAASTASRDEPDFAVEAVSALTSGKAAATVRAPVTLAATDPAGSRPAAAVPPAVRPVPAGPLLFSDVPSAGISSFTLAAPAAAGPASAGVAPGFSSAVPSGPPAPSPAVASPVATALAGIVPETSAATVPNDATPSGVSVVTAPIQQASVAPPPIVAAITPATGTPPAPAADSGDSVLSAIIAGISALDTRPAAAAPTRNAAVAAPAVVPAGPSRLLANVEKADETARARLEAQKAASTRVDKAEPGLPRKDARGRFVDAKGKPLLDSRSRPLDAKAAAAWLAAQNETKKAEKSDLDLPRKDARGRFVDAKGKPLLDARGRPLDAKAAAAWKQSEAKPKPEPAKGEPQRYWVQVAGGANEATLGKEWTRLAAATPSLKGKAGWTTPLRATNRVLTGPFKTGAEAMAMVNQLKKEGLSAFMFTSDAGQKVARLGGK